jgi:metal-responsive CopG/Arc/MetJ family transcriptional regulator
MLNFRAPSGLAEALDRAIADQPEPCSRSEFIRRILTEALSAKGYLPHRDDC